jgi:hypothetical protein
VTLGGLLFVLAHYQILLKTIMHAPSYIFPSLADDMHIMGPLSEIHAFDDLSTQGYTLIKDGLGILGVLVNS